MSYTDGLSPVIIGTREIYDEMQKILARQERDSAKLDRMSYQVEQLSTKVADQERRLRTLERARWPLPSVSLLVAVASFAAMLFKIH